MKKCYVFLFFALCSAFIFPQPYSPEVQAQFEANGSIEGAPFIEGVPIVSSPNSIWDSVAVAPNPFGRVSAGVIGNYLYVFGSQGTPTMAAAYNLTTKSWVASTTPTSTGFNIGACVANGELYKLGTVFEKFTPTGDGTGTWTVLTAAPSNLRGAENSVVWDGRTSLYANAGTTTNYFSKYNMLTDTWESLSLPPVANRRYAGLISLGGFIYRIGGLGETGWDGTLCHKYDTTTATWSAIASLPEPVNFTKWSTTTDGQYIYLVGSGGGFSPYTISNKVYMYNPANNTWTLESELPAIRGLALGIFLNQSHRLFFGGGNDGTSGSAYQNTCWEGRDGPYVPVELTSFTAIATIAGILLNWSTATELNNKGFVVEKSLNNNEWSALTFIKGKGTTTNRTDYSYSDNNLVTGKYFYRLKQIDQDGKVNYSSVAEADYFTAASFQLMQNYPNPFNPETIIKYQVPSAAKVNITVYNSLGEKVSTLLNDVKEAGAYQISFNAAGLPSGIYYCRLQSEGNVSTIKMLLVK